MTDRVRTLTVVLDQDIRTDDVQVIVDAISMLRYVSSVKLGAPVGPEQFVARMAVRSEVAAKLHDAIDEAFEPKADGKRSRT